MLNKVYEWLTVVYPQKPTSEIVTARTATVKSVLAALFESEDIDLLANYSVAAVCGLRDRFPSDSKVVTILVETIRAHQSAFPADLAENALELQIVSAIVLGELLSPAAREEHRHLSDLAAAMLLSLIECREPESSGHLAAVIQELVGLARTGLEESAQLARKRVELDLSELEEVEVSSDVPAFWTNLLPELVKAFNSLTEEAAKDREELELLWWMFNGFSNKLQLPVSSLPIDTAAIACGVEMASRVLLPVSGATAAMVEDAAVRGRKPSQLTEKSIDNCIGKWKKQTYDCLKPEEDAQRQFASSHPALFPLTWTAMRLDDSQGAAQVDGEIAKKTGLDPQHLVSKAHLARQAFREHTCLRMVGNYPVKDEE